MSKKILYVEWDDHSSSNNRWMRQDYYVEGNKPYPCVSVGVVVAEDNTAITLAGTWDTGSEEHYRDYKSDQTILKNCIRKRRVLRHK